MLSTMQVTAQYGWTANLLQAWRDNGVGPPYVVIVGRVFYPKNGIEDYIADRTVTPVARKGRKARAAHGAAASALLTGFIDALRGAHDGRPAGLERITGALNALPPNRTYTQALVEALVLSGADVLRLYPSAGYAVLTIDAHIGVPSERPPERVTIRVELDTMRWSSSYGATFEPGFVGLCRHVFYLRSPGDRQDCGAYRLLAVLGAAALRLFFDNAPDEAAAPAGNPPPLAPSIADMRDEDATA